MGGNHLYLVHSCERAAQPDLNSSTLNSRIDNRGYKYLVLFVMLAMTVTLSKGILSYRLVEVDGYIIQAGQLIAPVWFFLCDILAEVYGYRIAKQTIYAGVICQLIFAFTCNELLKLPFPSFWHDAAAYEVVLGNMLRVGFAVLIALAFSSLINAKLIVWSKFLAKGKHFWIRSIGATGISELLFSFLATFIIQYGKQPLELILSMAIHSAVIKFIFALLFSVPGNILAYYLKLAEGVDEEYISRKDINIRGRIKNECY